MLGADKTRPLKASLLQHVPSSPAGTCRSLQQPTPLRSPDYTALVPTPVCPGPHSSGESHPFAGGGERRSPVLFLLGVRIGGCSSGGEPLKRRYNHLLHPRGGRAGRLAVGISGIHDPSPGLQNKVGNDSQDEGATAQPHG